jgi:predicted aminopeptidase
LPITKTRLIAVAVLLGGCSTELGGYVLEQAWGQLVIMNQRRQISDVIQKEDLKPEWRQKLELVLLVREYAHRELGLRKTGAYTRFYDTKGRTLAYNLSACPKDSLRPKVWRFPVVGGLPYIGFFDRKKGEARRRELEQEGLDTYLRPVPAFSSLGWFADPVYSPMLERETPRLIDVVIHETTHTTIFLRGEVAFNESLAVFVGNQGTLNFLARLHGPTSPLVRDYARSIARKRRFARLVSELYRRLDRLYKGPLPREEKLRRREHEFLRAQRRYKEVFRDPDTWGRFVEQRLNNAVLLSYGRYNQGIEFHREVYERLGRDLGRLVALYKRAQRFDDPIDYVARVTGARRFGGQRM